MGNFLYTKMTGLRVGDAIGRFVTGRRLGVGEYVGTGVSGGNVTGGMILSVVAFWSFAHAIIKEITTIKVMHPLKTTHLTKQAKIVQHLFRCCSFVFL